MPFYHQPHPWNPGYAIPKYVLAEPPERGTFTTQWLPRGTISAVVPDFFAKPGRRLVGRTDADLGSLGGDNTLERHSLLSARVYDLEPTNTSGDPIASYGAKASSWIMSTIPRVPATHRKVAMRALLDAIDPTLWPAVEVRGAALRAAGASPKASLQQAIAESMASGVAGEIRAAGKRALQGSRRPVPERSQLGLGMYPDAQARAQGRAFEALGWNPFAAVAHAAQAIAGAVAKGAKNAAGEVWDGTKWVGGKVSAGASTAAGWAADGVKALGSLACGIANSGAGQLAATVGGGPVGAAGAAAVSGMCSKPNAASTSGQTMQYPAAQAPQAAAAGLPKWVLPVGAVAAVGAIALIAARR